eukprot:CAMPEP_0177619662 /NCGR_PEP_ID=MMETSP0419_2-20121207/26406_1 /TAXON_ID=582737 /ORGANISM="Tetraselmis sp., Strain GSL018" /LENGTH=174 /DNA_ID=CAMNT_0019118997 /DNA_START=629 /DNA_END=1153 /DNA_ORIENTATION=-
MYDKFKSLGDRLPPGLDSHFAPITEQCLISNGFQYDYILKLEQLDTWYVTFLELTRLQQEAAYGWHIDSYFNVLKQEQTCFYRPRGLDCSDVEKTAADCLERHPQSQQGNQSAPAASTHQQPKFQRSATGADHVLHDFYTPDLAAKVTEIFRPDLVAFGYPAWDGRSNYDARTV